MFNEDVRLRIKDDESPLDARPCLFFLNKQERHVHYFDLVRRKHANVYSPFFQFESTKINCFEIKSTYSYVVTENRRLTVIDTRDFSTFDELNLGCDILQVFCLGMERVLVVPREHGFLLIYNIEKGRVLRLDLNDRESSDVLSTGGSSTSANRYSEDMTMNLGCFMTGK